APVQRDEAAREAFALQVEEVALLRVERVRVHALRAQRLEDAVAAHQRDLALGGRTAHQHRNLAEVHAASPTMRPSGIRSIFVFSNPRRFTSVISHSISAAFAIPLGLTMKFACFSDTRAPPRSRPFRPQDSMRRAAWSPGGLRNTLPAFGSDSGCV